MSKSGKNNKLKKHLTRLYIQDWHHLMQPVHISWVKVPVHTMQKLHNEKSHKKMKKLDNLSKHTTLIEV